MCIYIYVYAHTWSERGREKARNKNGLAMRGLQHTTFRLADLVDTGEASQRELAVRYQEVARVEVPHNFHVGRYNETELPSSRRTVRGQRGLGKGSVGGEAESGRSAHSILTPKYAQTPSRLGILWACYKGHSPKQSRK